MSNFDEFERIRRMTSRLPSTKENVQVGIGDDTAVVSFPGDPSILMTTDVTVEGVHFLRSTLSFRDVGYKSVAVSISDIAAMGGRPEHVLIAIASPADVSMEDLEELYGGIAEICETYQCSVIGGDLVSTAGPFMITTTVTGTCPNGQAVLRSGANPGDVVFVTGTLGDSAGGLHVLQKETVLPMDERMKLMESHRRPHPHVTMGELFRTYGASSLNDVSDGLASEANEIAKASQVRIRIDADRVPTSPALRNLARQENVSPLEFAFYGGEDYQLVGTASAFSFARILAATTGLGVQLTQIGRVETGDGVVASMPDGRLEILRARGYNHFPPDDAKK